MKTKEELQKQLDDIKTQLNEPTETGIKNYLETDGYYNGVPCICEIGCIGCVGSCGCEACENWYRDDRKSERFEDSPNNHARYR